MTQKQLYKIITKETNRFIGLKNASIEVDYYNSDNSYFSIYFRIWKDLNIIYSKSAYIETEEDLPAFYEFVADQLKYYNEHK